MIEKNPSRLARNQRALTSLSLMAGSNGAEAPAANKVLVRAIPEADRGFRYPPTGFPGQSNGRYRYAHTSLLSIEAPECRVNGPGLPRIFLVQIGKSESAAGVSPQKMSALRPLSEAQERHLRGK
jgi:hypothetical protein